MPNLYQRILNGVIYDCVQTLAGARKLDQRIFKILPDCRGVHRVLDVGGGTGRAIQFAPPGARYICLDLEIHKLQRFRSRHGRGLPLLADACQAPLPDNSIDLVICIAVAHHIDDANLGRFFADTRRVLAPGGYLVFVDPLWRPARIQSRLMWSIDRGSYPRTSAHLSSAIAALFSVVHQEEYRIYHEYLILVAQK